MKSGLGSRLTAQPVLFDEHKARRYPNPVRNRSIHSYQPDCPAPARECTISIGPGRELVNIDQKKAKSGLHPSGYSLALCLCLREGSESADMSVRAGTSTPKGLQADIRKEIDEKSHHFRI
jgi:hypothetical protein